MATPRFLVGVLAGLAAMPLAGCGATGLSWVGEAHVQATQHTVSSASSVQSPARVIPAPAQQAGEDAPRPRLSRTVTLGESELMGQSARGSNGAAPSSGTSVTINNYNVLNAPTVGYGYTRGYGSFGGYSGSLGSRSYSSPGFSSARSSSSPQPGQNWPAISDHGPSFPLRSAPAPQWSR